MRKPDSCSTFSSAGAPARSETVSGGERFRYRSDEQLFGHGGAYRRIFTRRQSGVSLSGRSGGRFRGAAGERRRGGRLVHLRRETHRPRLSRTGNFRAEAPFLPDSAASGGCDPGGTADVQPLAESAGPFFPPCDGGVCHPATHAAPDYSENRSAAPLLRGGEPPTGGTTVRPPGGSGEHPDLILLPENLNTRSTPGLPSRKAQPVPGPWSEFLATQAKRFGSYIVTTLVERKGDALYNTAIIFDRNGELVGKYRKVHLTLSEAEAGFLPGSEFPVFPLDCVRVGIATCWDNWFSESVRHLALNGAELVLFPLAGDGDETHWRHIWPARAMDNGVILAASISQGEAKEPTPAQIILPDGSIAAETQENPGYAAATLDLNRRYLTYWLSVGPFFGEGPSLYRLERRDSVY
ncbi:MAG: hypothetical protein L6W00_26520 [Lentisphaeria bacterium]|nr:MAG: hypothetical protein L6W00_26520 [Lentisphaeria bacterium]